jgi:ATP-binding cassette, subfamily B (MDR/TAP), member 1
VVQINIKEKQDKSADVKVMPQGAPEMVEFSKFFTYMTCKEKAMLIIGTIGAVCAGVLLPCIAIAMGAVTNTYNPSNTKDDVLDSMKLICLYICLVGLGTWLFGYFYFAFWQHLAQNISFDLRSRYLHAILKQEVAFFELTNVEQLPSQIGENFFIITESIGEKYSNIIYSVSTLIGGVAIAFFEGADFAGVCAAFIPVLFIIMVIFGGIVKKATLAKMAVLKKLGGVVEESLTAIRLISSFANEKKEEDKFYKLAKET